MKVDYKDGEIVLSSFSHERAQFSRLFGARNRESVHIPFTHPAVLYEVLDLLNVHPAQSSPAFDNLKNVYKVVPYVPGRIGGVTLYPFQVDGVRFALRNRRVLIADDMGLGKTIQALAVAYLAKAKRVLVICPKAVLYNWQAEAERFGFHPKVYDNGEINPEFTIVNYERLVSRFVHFTNRDWDFIIVDESHYIKERTSKRTKCVHALVKQPSVNYVLLLSGTPQPNYPYELWAQLHALDPRRFSNFNVFARQFCNAHKSRFGWDYRGANNLGYLQRLLSYYMIRRKRLDVMKQLPKLVRQNIFVNLQADKRYKHVIRQVLDELSRLNPEAKAVPHIAHLRVAMGLMKVPFVAEFVTMLMDYPDTNVVVYAHHHIVIDMLRDALSSYKPLVLDGRVSADAQNIVSRFQRGESRIIIISSAGGMGINLQRANVVVFAEREWTPALEDQIEGRAWRIGNTHEKLLAYYIVGKGFDERIQAVLDTKRSLQAVTIKDVVKILQIDLE